MFNLRDFRSSPTWLSHLVLPPVMCDNPPPISASSLSLGDGMVPVAGYFTNIYSLCVDQMCVSLLTTVLSCYFQVFPLHTVTLVLSFLLSMEQDTGSQLLFLREHLVISVSFVGRFLLFSLSCLCTLD